mmetsp:Transcript_8590/g.12886  ORF Transcript_8590/g.12886 Transcript_8590/m.12886 type:complete len:345 (+) Transcript_8590:41-1075(+)
MSKECKLNLEKSLASLLGYDIEDVVDFIDPLLGFESKEDVLEYLSGLLGRQDEEVLSFVDNIMRFQRGEEIAMVGNDGGSCSTETKPSSSENIGSKGGGGANKSSIGSSVEKQAKDKEDKREKQRKQDEERRRKREIEMEQEKKLERIKAEQQKEMDRIQNAQRNAKKQNNKGCVKKQPLPRRKEKNNNDGNSSSSKVVPIVVKPNKNEHQEAQKPAPPQRGKAKIVCGCFGTVHKPLTNCLHCGRISCTKEGYGYCPHCGYLVDRSTMPEGAKFDKAVMHKERLLQFDRDSASRTVVFDSQADYYSNSKSNWLTKEEQLDAEMKEESRRKDLHDRKYILKLDT